MPAAPFPALLGYADRFSVAPGQTLACMVSAEVPRYHAGLVRLIQGDESPAGPGYHEEPVASPIDGDYPGRRQPLVAGSYLRVPSAGLPDLSRGFSVGLWLWPTTPTKPGGQALLACWSQADAAGLAFGLDADGHLELHLGFGHGHSERITSPGPPVAPWRWLFAAATYDAATGLVRLVQATGGLYANPAPAVHSQRLAQSEPLAWPAQADLLLAARALETTDPPVPGRVRPVGVYNGKLDRPWLFDRPLTLDELDLLRHDAATPPAGLVAAWDFQLSLDVADPHRVSDTSPNHLDGTLVNLPTRAVTDHTWTGHQVHWQRAPDQYAAIHFHDDDLEDTGWQPDLHLRVPDDLPSGVYAIHLTAGADEAYVPFWVRPRPGTASAAVAFLAPTLTYLAYANERLYWNPGYLEKRGRVTPLETEPPDLDQFMAEHRELGLSLYDVHSDGSGCCYSSRLRPILNMQPKYRAWRLHDAPRHFAADLYLIAWLEARGIGYDVITDEDLHAEGTSLLARYRVVLTGSHPEYVTEAMRLGVEGYLEQGGRLMYLGGNGFYWVTSVDPERPHVIEVRRGISGTRAWESQPGEGCHSTTGEVGGLWRQRGHSPHRLLGVGFASQGWGGAAGYVRLPGSFDPRAAFIFAGLDPTDDEAPIGDFGLVLGGAAGDEIDRFDLRLGSPPHALLLATSAGRHSDYYQVTVEDVPVMVPGQGGTQSPLVRSDLVFFETPNGGAVFSTGSINWLGSLAWNRFSNPVAQITDNVLRRFLDPRPFELA